MEGTAPGFSAFATVCLVRPARNASSSCVIRRARRRVRILEISAYALCMIRTAHNIRTSVGRTKCAATRTRKLRTLIPVTREEELEICGRIKEARKQAGFSQAEFADLLHVILRTVQNYEKDRVPWRHLRQIEKLTKTSEEWLLHGDKLKQESELERLTAEADAGRGEMRARLRDVPLSRGTQTAGKAGQEKAGRRSSTPVKPAPRKKKSAEG